MRMGERAWALGLLTGCAVLTVLLMPWRQLLTFDSSFFATLGHMWLQGAVPYRDVSLSKPPLLVPLNALADVLGVALGIGIHDGVRLVSSAAVVGLAMSMAGLLRCFGISRLVTSLTVLLVVLLFADTFFSLGGGLSEPPAFALALFAWLLVERTSRALLVLVAGALLAMAIGISLLAAGIGVGAVLAIISKPEPGSVRLRLLGILMLGGLVVLIPVLAYFWQAGAMTDMWRQVITFNSVYGAVSCPIANSVGWPCGTSQAFLVALLFSLGILFSLAAAATLAVYGQMSRTLKLRLFAVLVILSALALATLRRAPNGHYWWPVIIGLLPFAAFGLDGVWRRIRKAGPGRRARLAAAASSLLLLEQLMAPGIGLAVYHQFSDPRFAEGNRNLEQIGLLIDAASPAQAPLFSWGTYSQVYLVSHRAPAGLTLYTYELMLPGYTTAQSYKDVCQLLAQKQPIIFDYSPELSLVVGAPVPGGIDQAWIAPTRALLARDWIQVGQVGDGRVLAPRSGISPSLADCDVQP